jgi:hypothetical protein
MVLIANRTICDTGCRTVVRGGIADAAGVVSSNPTIETSSGIRRPAAAAAE